MFFRRAERNPCTFGSNPVAADRAQAPIATMRSAHTLPQRLSRTARAQYDPKLPWKAEQPHRRHSFGRSATCKRESRAGVTRTECMSQTRASVLQRGLVFGSGTGRTQPAQWQRRRALASMMAHSFVGCCHLRKNEGAQCSTARCRIDSAPSTGTGGCSWPVPVDGAVPLASRVRPRREPSRSVCSDFRPSIRFDRLLLQHISSA